MYVNDYHISRRGQRLESTTDHGGAPFRSDSQPVCHLFSFMENSIDYLLGDVELVDIRSRKITDRPLLTESEGLDDSARARWKWFNILGSSILVVIFGFIHLKRENSRAKALREIYD